MSIPSQRSNKKRESPKSLEEFLELNEAQTRALKKLLKLMEEEQQKTGKAINKKEKK